MILCMIVVIMQVAAVAAVMLGFSRYTKLTARGNGFDTDKAKQMFLCFMIAVILIAAAFYIRKIGDVPDKFWIEYWANRLLFMITQAMS